MRRTFRKGSLRLIELAVRLGDHPERRESIADAVVVTDALGQVQGFIRRCFCTPLHLAVAHHRSTYAIEELDAEREWRCRLSLLSRPEVQRQHAFHYRSGMPWRSTSACLATRFQSE